MVPGFGSALIDIFIDYLALRFVLAGLVLQVFAVQVFALETEVDV